MSDMTLGTVIAAKRKEKGMTQAELAEKMGVTDKAVSKWERDLSYPDVASFPRLARILGVSLDELMEGTDDKKGRNNAEDIIWIAARGIALAMGVAVTVLSILGELDSGSGLGMLGIGLACIAIYLLKDGRK